MYICYYCCEEYTDAEALARNRCCCGEQLESLELYEEEQQPI
jgi:hypothetical protein